jgi:FkbM family methyltransferase
MNGSAQGMVASLELYVKSRLIGTPAEGLSKRLRWLLAAKHRRKHPELWELYLEELRLPLILQKLVTDNSCCVDVGSHLGSFLNLLTELAPNGRHIAFEPITSKNIWLKKRFPKAEVFPFAVADKSGTATFEEDLTNSGYSGLQQLVRQSDQISAYEVQICRLDDVLPGKGRIDLIKLDVEGGEFAALQGARKTIKTWRPCLIFECGSEYFLSERKLSRKDLYDLIVQDLDYEIFCFGDLLYDKGNLCFDEFRKCGLYPFRAFNFVARPKE